MASGRGASSRWFFTREQLENTPSRRCGVEADIELSYRQQAANLIQEMGQRLNVYPFLCLALHCSRPVPTTRRVSRPGAPRTWRRSSRAPRPRPKGRLGLGRPRAAREPEGGREELGMRTGGRAWWRRGGSAARRGENRRGCGRREAAARALVREGAGRPG